MEPWLGRGQPCPALCSIAALAMGISAWPRAPRCCPQPAEQLLPPAEERTPLWSERRQGKGSLSNLAIKPRSQGELRRTLQGKASLAVGPPPPSPSLSCLQGPCCAQGRRSEGCWRCRTPAPLWGVTETPSASPQGPAISQETLEKHRWTKHRQPSFLVETKNMP